MDNTVLNDTAGAALRQLGAEYDAAGGDLSSATPTPEPRAAGTAENPAEQTPAAPKVDVDGVPETPAAKPAEQEQQPPAPEQKTDSKFEKARKDAARRDESWKKLNEEKAQLQRDREEIERLRRQPAPPPPEAKKPVGPTKDERGHTADDYEEAAKGFDADGDADLAQRARAQAAALRQQDATAQTQAVATDQTAAVRERFANDWRSDMETAIRAHPALGQPESADAKELTELLEHEPIFGQIPNGFSRAVEVLKLRREAAQAPGLREQVTTLKSEIERLTKLTQLNGGSPATPAGSKRFEDMSEAEQRDHLQRKAAAADGF